MNFIDDASAERIGLTRIRQRLQPLSPYGRLLKSRMPVFLPGCEELVRAEWALVHGVLAARALEPAAVDAVEMRLRSLKDIRGIVRKAREGLVLEDVELFAVKRFLQLTEQLAQLLAPADWLPRRLQPPDLSRLREALAAGSNSGFYIGDSCAANLAALRREQRRLKDRLAEMRKRSRQEIEALTGRTFNHQGRLRVNKLEGELLAKVAGLPQLVLAAETFSEAEFALKPSAEMLALEEHIGRLETDISALEQQVRQKLSREVAVAGPRLLAACRRLGRIDLLLAKARLAGETGWCLPRLTGDNCIRLAEFTNPVIGEHLAAQGLSFQPLSLELGRTPVTVITGANMGGKSVTLKSVGLAVAMAQLGLLVPAREFEFSLRAFIYYSLQGEDADRGLSTFGAEIQALAAWLPHKNRHGLYLLDEPARGTNPWEGSALVRAILHWLAGGNSLTLAATHFPGVAGMPGVTHLQVAGLSAADLQTVLARGAGGTEALRNLMDYSLVPGTGAVPRDALKIAAFLGLEPEVLALAEKELGRKPWKELRE